MEFHLPKRIKTFYWRVFPVPFLWIAYYQIVHDWQLEQFGFDELEDVGTLLFILGVSACEAALVRCSYGTSLNRLRSYYLQPNDFS